ncbi:MAG: phosphotransferase [Capsulimonadales bacterium]|nr:phosphotransferase [Capsulimonadales bacterium]
MKEKRRQFLRPAKQALERFGKAGAILTRLKTQATQSVFQVSAADGAYVLRLFSGGPERLFQAQFERAFLEAIAVGTDLRAPRVIDMVALDETNHAALLTFVPGEKAGKRPTDAHAGAVGDFLGRLHRFSATYPRAAEPRWDFDRVFAPLVVPENAAWFAPEQRVVLQAAGERIRSALRTLGTGADVYGVIHSDLHFDNCVFEEGQIGAFDFAECGYSWFLFDLAVVLMDIRWDMPEIAPPREAALLAAYERQRPLLPSEHRSLEDIIALRFVEMLTWHFTENTEAEKIRYEEDARKDADFAIAYLQRYLTQGHGEAG